MHDAKGNPLAVGDQVVLPGTIKDLGVGNDQFCNVTVELAYPMPGYPDRRDQLSALNTKMLEKVFGRPDGDIGWALGQMQLGKKVRRAGWNGKGMFIVLMPELQLPPFNTQEPGPKVNDRTAKHIGEATPLDSRPYIAMWTARGQWQPGWLCSQADLLATDWELAPDTIEDEIPF